MNNTLEKKVSDQTRHLDVLNSKKNQRFGTIVHNCTSSAIWSQFFYFLGIVCIVTDQHFMLECKVEVHDCRLFPQQGEMQLTEDDGNSLSEMDNEFGEELNDEWGLENQEELQDQSKCNCAISNQIRESAIIVTSAAFTEALCITTLLFEERNKLIITRTSIFLIGIDQHLIKNQFQLRQRIGGELATLQSAVMPMDNRTIHGMERKF